MKKGLLFWLFAALALSIVSSCVNDELDDIKSDISDLDERVTSLEEVCSSFNAQIQSLNDLIDRVDAMDYVTSVDAINGSDGAIIGYTLNFLYGDSVTIYIYGSADGGLPIIGVAIDDDGYYYWTIQYGSNDVEWLTDGDGNKIRASATDGANGEDGYTPVITIGEYDGVYYWQVDGEWMLVDGEKVPVSGDDGDSFFAENGVDLESNPGFVVLTLANGTSITLPLASSVYVTFESYDSITITDAATETVVALGYPATLGEDDFIAVTATIYDGNGSSTDVATRSEEASTKWDVEIVAPEFDEQGAIIAGSSYVTIIPSQAAIEEKEVAILKVSIIDSEGKESSVSRVIKVVDAIEAERDALMVIYNTSTGSDWTNSTNWGSDLPVGEWWGITTNDEGFVTSIVLSNMGTSDYTTNNLVNVLGEPMIVDGFAYLEEFIVAENSALEEIQITNCPNVKILNVNDLDDKAFAGVDLTQLPLLEEYYCNYNPYVKSIDFSQSANLKYLDLYFSTGLSSLDLTPCVSLEEIIARNTVYTSFDFSKNSALKKLTLSYCTATNSIIMPEENNLEVVDITSTKFAAVDFSKAANLTYLKFSSSSVLTEIDLSSSTKLEKLIGGSASMLQKLILPSEACPVDSVILYSCKNLSTVENLANQESIAYLRLNSTLVREINISNFADKLKLLYCGAAGMTSLDLKGCVNLTDLSCSGSETLAELDLSDCSSLTSMTCTTAMLKELDLKGATSLTKLTLNDNQIAEIDLSVCPTLQTLSINNNLITSIDLSDASALTSLSISGNQITSIDLSKCTELTSVDVDDNLLTELDVAVCPSIQKVYCSGNSAISSLNTSQITSLTTLECNNTAVEEINVAMSQSMSVLDCSGCSVKKISLYTTLSSWNLDYDNWGDYDTLLYVSPTHTNGYQYPEFSYVL